MVLRMHARNRGAATLMVLALVALASPAAPVAAAVTPPPAPTYSQTIGGPAHATMYPSGVDTYNGVVYIADTGNDQVAAYDAYGTRSGGWACAGPSGPEASTTRETSPTSTAASTLPTPATTGCRC